MEREKKEDGGAEEIRTPGLVLAKDALCQLSHCPTVNIVFVFSGAFNKHLDVTQLQYRIVVWRYCMKKYNLLIVAACLAIVSCGGIKQGIKGKLTDKIFGDPISGVDVKIVAYDTQNLDTYPVKINDDGTFEMSLEPGSYRFEAVDNRQEYVYGRIIEPFKIQKDSVYEHEFKLDPIVKQWIHGTVTDKATKKPIAGATLSFNKLSGTTNKNGDYEIRNYRPGIVKMEVKAKGYATLSKDYRLTAGESIEDVELSPASYIEGATVKPLGELVSYVIQTSKGTSEAEISSMDSIIINNLPWGAKIESGKDIVYQFLGKFYSFDGKNYKEISKEAYEKISKPTLEEHTAMIEGAFKKFNSLKKSLSTDVIKLESANLVSYKFTYNHEGTEYNCELMLYSDGALVGYANSLTMAIPNKYYKFEFQSFNQPGNTINIPVKPQ